MARPAVIRQCVSISNVFASDAERGLCARKHAFRSHEDALSEAFMRNSTDPHGLSPLISEHGEVAATRPSMGHEAI